MSLPLTILIQPAPGAVAAIRAALPQGADIHLQETGGTLTLRCPREHKMAVLGCLTALGSQVQDLQLRDASLEDVFFGVAT
jgi:Cu-processing system ATP-binding protein